MLKILNSNYLYIHSIIILKFILLFNNIIKAVIHIPHGYNNLSLKTMYVKRIFNIHTKPQKYRKTKFLASNYLQGTA